MCLSSPGDTSISHTFSAWGEPSTESCPLLPRPQLSQEKFRGPGWGEGGMAFGILILLPVRSPGAGVSPIQRPLHLSQWPLLTLHLSPASLYSLFPLD
jgi:hypothetical protein